MQHDNSEIKAPLLKQVSKYLLFILKVIGFVKDDDFGYANNESGDTESLITPIMDVLRDFRIDIKQAVSGKEIVKKDVMNILDNLRDKKLPNLGIKLEDRKEGSIWSYVDRDTLLKEIRIEEEKKESKKREAEEKKAKELKEKSTPPELYFKEIEPDSKY